jgi:hypothetical protein
MVECSPGKTTILYVGIVAVIIVLRNNTESCLLGCQWCFRDFSLATNVVSPDVGPINLAQDLVKFWRNEEFHEAIQQGIRSAFQVSLAYLVCLNTRKTCCRNHH